MESKQCAAVSCVKSLRLLSAPASASTAISKPQNTLATLPQAWTLCKGLDLGRQSALSHVAHHSISPLHTQLSVQRPRSSASTSFSSHRSHTTDSRTSVRRPSTAHASHAIQRTSPASLPSNIEEFSTSWLTEVLRTSGAIGADSAVDSFSSEIVGEGVGLMSSVHKVKLMYSGAPGPRAPSGLVAKFEQPSGPGRECAIR